LASELRVSNANRNERSNWAIFPSRVDERDSISESLEIDSSMSISIGLLGTLLGSLTGVDITGVKQIEVG
jgi:hypothetical protein